jgi:hypothetical protein
MSTLFAGLGGCGQSGPQAFLPVEGQVKFGGQVLTRGTVVLHPDAARGNATKHEPRGAIGPDGRYHVFTHPHAGAPPGWYKVTVIAMEPSDPKNPYALPRSLIPDRFGKLDQSSLAFEVRKDAPAGAYDLELQ